MEQLILTGIVLSAAPAGEYDRRLLILTRERGKITAFARGVRKPRSPLVGATSPFSFGEFTLYEGKSAYTLVSASISCFFSELREDLEGACYGYYFLEVAGYYSGEGKEASELIKLLYLSLKALSKDALPNRLVRRVFEMKAIMLEGEGPEVFTCLGCGDSHQEENRWFSTKRGGILCGKCQGRYRDAAPLSDSVAYTLRFISDAPLSKLYTFVLSQEAFQEFADIVDQYMDTYVGKRFSSLEILETMLK